MSGAELTPKTTLKVFCLCPIVLKQGLKRAGGPTHHEVRSGWIKNGISRKFCRLISPKKAVTEASKRRSNSLNEDRHRTSKKGVHAVRKRPSQQLQKSVQTTRKDRPEQFFFWKKRNVSVTLQFYRSFLWPILSFELRSATQDCVLALKDTT